MSIHSEALPYYVAMTHGPSSVRAIYQDAFGEVVGNCWSACLATLVGVALDETREHHAAYLAAIHEWDIVFGDATRQEYVERFGSTTFQRVTDLWLATLPKPYVASYVMGDLAPAGWSIACGDNFKGAAHACVACDGAIVHDPNLRRSFRGPEWGLKAVDHWVILTPGVERE